MMRGVGGVAGPPQAVADDGHQLGAVQRSGGGEAGAGLRADSQQLEQVAADLDGVDPQRLLSGVHQVDAGTPPRRRVREHRERPVVHEVDRRHGVVREPLGGIGVPQGHEPIWLDVGQRPEHHGIDDAEDRGRRAGAEPEHEHGHQRERGPLAELANGVTQGGSHRLGWTAARADWLAAICNGACHRYNSRRGRNCNPAFDSGRPRGALPVAARGERFSRLVASGALAA